MNKMAALHWVVLGIVHMATVTAGASGTGRHTPYNYHTFRTFHTFQSFQTQNRGQVSQNVLQPSPVNGRVAILKVQLTTAVTFIEFPDSLPLPQHVVSNPSGLLSAYHTACQRQWNLTRRARFLQELGLDTQRARTTVALHTVFIGTKPSSLAFDQDNNIVNFLLQEIFTAMGLSIQRQLQALREVLVYNKQGLPVPTLPPVSALARPPPPSHPWNSQTQGSFSSSANGDGYGSSSSGSGSQSAPLLTCQNARNLTCDCQARFRTQNGTCNNLDHNRWGASFIPLRRYLSPVYDDGRSQPRTRSRVGGPLPSARLVSIQVHPDGPGQQVTELTHMVMQWGQFADHDITSTPIHTAPNISTPYGNALTCCQDDVPGKSKSLVDVSKRPECFPIMITPNDPFFTHRTCLSFPRSLQATNAQCHESPAEQSNQITSYMDASQVYGSTDDEAEKLRTHSQGQLKTSQNDLLPKDPEGKCLMPNTGIDYCFKAGDERVNEQMALTSLHTVFLRLHNRLAQRLAQLNRGWGDERLFQEARKMVGAVMQKITYGDWLPIVLDRRRLQQHGLALLTSGQRNVYSPQEDVSIRNVFATAAFRFGHSLIRTTFTQMGQNYQRRGRWRLEQSFGNTSLLLDFSAGAVGRYMRGMLRDAPNRVDRFFSGAIRDRLFLDFKGNSFDLVALNIQRGRDHGLPGYNAWRRFCHLAPVTFNNMPDHDPSVAQRFAQVYRHPDDIDVFSGGISERAEGGGLVGPLFACILAKQFHSIKFGDRFWFETTDPVTGFTPGQLREIRKLSLSRILCDVTNIRQIQPNAFRQVSNGNPLLNCEELPELEVGEWRVGGGGGGEAGGSWSSWGRWGPCGGGRQSRQRQCRKERKGAWCSGPCREVRSCGGGGGGDPKWTNGQWSAWSTCHQGYQIRVRMCKGSAQSCPPGPNQQRRDCWWSGKVMPTPAPPGPPPGWGSWGPWAGVCAGGKQWRRRACHKPPRVWGQAWTPGACSGPGAQSRACGAKGGGGGAWGGGSRGGGHGGSGGPWYVQYHLG